MSYSHYYEIKFHSDDFKHWAEKDYKPVESFVFRTINFDSLVTEYLRIKRKYCKKRVSNYDPFNVTCSFDICIVFSPFSNVCSTEDNRHILYKSDNYLIRRI